MFIDFEGIDGSGKTTLSNRLAQRLKRLGYRVNHAREGGTLKARASQRIRSLTRDPQLLELCPRAEFLLNLARDAQQLDEVVKPALERGEVVLTDRYLPSQLALSHAGRGLPLAELEPALRVASQGIWPDLIILVDVEPELARLRKRLGKIQEEREGDPPSRKGLAGSGLAARAREAFLGMARADPGRWLVVVNDDQPLWVLEQRIVDAVLARLEGREPTVQPIVPPGHALPPPEPTVQGVGERFFRLLDSLEAREPGLAAFLLSGLHGLPAHQRRLALAERFPRLVARGLRGLDDEGSFALRELLKEQAPVEVAMGLPKGLPRAMALREELFERAPKQVVEGLAGDRSEKAWALRDRALAKGALGPVLVSLAGDDSPRAWTLREVAFSSGLYDAVAESLVGLPGQRAEAMREQLVPLDRLAALRALAGMDTPLAARLRQELVERAAKPVMRSLAGMATEHAFALREQVVERAPEALESLEGLDDERAWAMREQYAGRWPSAVIGSLGTAGLCARGQALLARVLNACPDRLPVVRDAYALLVEAAEGPARSERAPAGVTARPSAEVSAP